MALVNLFVVGAMKAGSTTLHEYLDEHPQVFMSPIKEPGYFVPELWNGQPDEVYEALFEKANGAPYRGESSTHYTKIPTYNSVPDRIHAYNPDARILYIMRHPIKRLISHYYHAVRDIDFYGETRPISKAIKKDPMYLAYSDYAMQLEPYYQLFGKDQVYVLAFEELVADPQSELEPLFRWLALDPGKTAIKTIASNQAPEQYKRARGLGLLNRLRHTESWDKISGMVPRKLKDIGIAMAEKPSSEKLSAEEERELWEQLEPLFTEKQPRLEKLVGRRFDVWGLKREE